MIAPHIYIHGIFRYIYPRSENGIFPLCYILGGVCCMPLLKMSTFYAVVYS